MQLFLTFLFIFFPVFEIITFMRVASRIGLGNALVLIILSGIFGAYLAKVQGRTALTRVQEAFLQGRQPTNEMLDGLLIFIGGILFIVPGFLSDILGLVLLFPLTRWLVKMSILGFGRKEPRSRQSNKREGPGPYKKRDDVEDAEIIE